MTISFDLIPEGIVEGGLYAELVSTGAGVGGMPKRALLVCPTLATGLLSATAPRRVFSSAEADKLCGAGSIGAALIRAFMKAAPSVEVHAIAIEEGATAADCEITIAGPTTSAGTMALYVAGERYAADVASGATALEVAQALAAEVTADARAMVTAVAAAAAPNATLTLTSRNKLAIANDIDVRFNYYASDLKAAPKGLTLTIPPAGMDGGAGAAVAADVVDAIAGQQFHTIVWPDAVQASLTDVGAELATRWGPMVQQEGHCFAAIPGDVSEATTLGTALNCPHVTVTGTSDSPTLPCIWAATLAAIDAAQSDPARPRRTLPLPGVKAPVAIWDRLDRRSAILGGAATWTVDAGGNVLCDRLVTTYRLNPDGLPDSAYREVTTVRTLAEMRWEWNARVQAKYPRCKLGDDATDFPPGQAIVQPKTIRAESIAIYDDWIEKAWVQDAQGFAEHLLVERHVGDANRLDARMKVKIVGKFLTLATRMEFEQ